MKRLTTLALATPMLVWFASQATAQTAATAQPAAAASNQIPEVVVTARKRSENVQSVAATVQVVDKAQLARAGVATLEDISTVAPGVNISNAPSPNQYAVTIRGLGSEPGNPSFDSSVSLFVDGVYTPRAREFSASLFDISNLETIRGTQAALLGKNTSLGAINLVTTKPGSTYEIDARYQHEFELGSDRVEGGFNIPVSDSLKFRVSGVYDNEAGPVHDKISDTYGLDAKSSAGRIIGVWNPTDTVDVTAMFQAQKVLDTGGAAEFVQATAAAGGLAALAGHPGTVDPNFDYQTALFSSDLNGAGRQNELAQRGALTINWRLGGHTLTSQTGYTGSQDNSTGNVSYLPSNFFRQYITDRSRQVTEEVRLASPTGHRLDYIVGALYLDGRYTNNTLQTAAYPVTTPGAPPIAGSENTFFDQSDKAYSAFGQANYKIFEQLKLTAGVRYTSETKAIDVSRQTLSPGLYTLLVMPPYPLRHYSKTEDSLDGSIGLNYQLDRNTLLYASWGQGTKAGGFAQAASDLTKTAYDPEVAQTAEAGFKEQLFGRSLTVNGAAFYTTVHDFQLVTFTGTSFIVGNTDLRSIGFESEVDWVPVRHVRLFWNNIYADAQDTRVGGDIPFAPRWSGSTGASYTHDVFGSLRASLDLDLDYRSTETSQENAGLVPPLAASKRLNISAGVADPATGLEVRVIGKNLNNEHVLGFEFPGPLLPAGNVIGVPLNPMTIMLQISYKH